MIVKAKTAALAASLLLNLLFAALFLSALTGKSSPLAYYSMDRAGTPSTAAAVVACVPLGSGTVAFNAVEIGLRVGEAAHLQISTAVAGKQANWIISAIYDRSIISTAQNGFGITITALRAGETVMQTLTEDGFRDVAFVKVEER
jgi:hypothetical protein